MEGNPILFRALICAGLILAVFIFAFLSLYLLL